MTCAEMIREIYQAVADGKCPMSVINGFRRSLNKKYPKPYHAATLEEMQTFDVEHLLDNVRKWIAAMEKEKENSK